MPEVHIFAAKTSAIKTIVVRVTIYESRHTNATWRLQPAYYAWIPILNGTKIVAISSWVITFHYTLSITTYIYATNTIRRIQRRNSGNTTYFTGPVHPPRLANMSYRIPQYPHWASKRRAIESRLMPTLCSKLISNTKKLGAVPLNERPVVLLQLLREACKPTSPDCAYRQQCTERAHSLKGRENRCGDASERGGDQLSSWS